MTWYAERSNRQDRTSATSRSGQPEPTSQTAPAAIKTELRAFPDRAHVDVFVAVAPEQEQTQGIGEQADQAEAPHQFEDPQGRRGDFVDYLRDDGEGRRQNEQALE